ncbi:MarR family winged helix-turn-helix transcriptional regulator [Flindersiella endophytica]
MPPARAPIQLGLLLRQSHRRAAGALNDALAPLGLTGKHFGVLLLIHRDGVSTQRDLIQETGSDKAGMVRTVEDLEKLGYLTRTRSTTDKRVADLTLTRAGEEAFATARQLAGKTARELFGMFSAAEIEKLEELLTRFLADDSALTEQRAAR